MTYRPNHSQPGRVTDMLHTLRGEQFRHSQNVNRTRGSFSTSSFTSSAPIPFLKLDYSPVPESAIPLQVDTPKAAGPPLPKSWQLKSTEDKDGRHSAAWRAKTLSLIFQHRPSSQRFSLETDQISSLTQLCLGKLLSECSTVEFIEDVIPCLPVHLRLELIRYAAIHCPLSDKMLHALLGSEGHTDGELVVVGSSASHPADHFLKAQIQGTAGDDSSQRDSPKDWDVDDSTSVSLQSLIVVSNRLLALKLLPPTITHLVLINLENPIALHRLPRLVPLLVVLDLSYNRWLDSYSDETLRSIERIGWDRWTQLRILGWRGNVIPEGMVIRLNKGRWDDVEIVLE